LLKEKAVLEQRTQVLTKTVKLATQKVAAERLEHERLLGEKAVLEQRAAEMTRALRMATSKVETDRAEYEKLLKEKAVLEQRTAELARAVRTASRRAEIERVEREKAAAAKRQAEQRVEALFAAVRSSEPQAVTPETDKLPRLTLQGGPAKTGTAPPPARRPPLPGAFFRVEWDLTGIVCDGNMKVLEVYRSISMAQLSLEGYPSQYCSAYVVGLVRGQQRQVSVAFRLASSDRTLLYVPAKKLESKEAYGQALQQARKFLQVVGMDIEPLEFEASAQDQSRLFETLPIFEAAHRSVEGF
jgi:hypothetical protein